MVFMDFLPKDITEESAEDFTVQVGDPFQEKLLLEATLEAFAKTDACCWNIRHGGLGITCSSNEMSKLWKTWYGIMA